MRLRMQSWSLSRRVKSTRLGLLKLEIELGMGSNSTRNVTSSKQSTGQGDGLKSVPGIVESLELSEEKDSVADEEDNGDDVKCDVMG